MNQTIDSILKDIEAKGNLRVLPGDLPQGTVDLSSNDYLGLATDVKLQEEFFAQNRVGDLPMSASASRLLAGVQSPFRDLESTIESAFGCGKAALLFNSGYHANTGIIGAFAGTDYYILADKLVHASIIDGIRLSGLDFARFRHNDYGHLERLAEKATRDGRKLLIIVESVYSMDGDSADIDALIAIKKRYEDAILYVDEAHALGVCGPAGLGLCVVGDRLKDVDITVGTFGKALASCGAFAVCAPSVKRFLVNKSRSLIFSTALPPLNIAWTNFVFKHMMGMDTTRTHLSQLCSQLKTILENFGAKPCNSHIQPLITGSPQSAVDFSKKLRDEGFTVLPIRTPTVPPGTDRLRFSLSASLTNADLDKLERSLSNIFLNTNEKKI